MIDSSTAADDPVAMILAAPMSAFQMFCVLLTVTLCALDGFNVLSATMAAPGIVRELGVGKAALGGVFSSALMGMAAGSLLLGPLADTIGRRTLILIGLLVIAVSSLSTAAIHSLATLTAWRFVTGLGVGAMISVVYPLAAEYANERRRDLAVGLTAVGYGIGGVTGGLVVAQLLLHFDWRSIFVLGGSAALALAPVVYFVLPETVPFLLTRNDGNSLAKVNSYLGRCNLQSVSTLPPAPARHARVPLREIFRPAARKTTLLITVTNLLFVITGYSMASWIPQMVAELGFSQSQAAQMSVILNLGGVVGGTVFGWLAPRTGLKPLMLAAFPGAALMSTLFGFTPKDIGLLTVVTAMAGFFQIAGMTGIFAVIVNSFDTHVRATGAGFVIGIGRISSAAGPAMGGLLMAAGVGRGFATMAMAFPALLATFTFLAFRIRKPSSRAAAAH